LKENFISRSWLGTEKLWKVFWLYNVLTGLVVDFIFNKLLLGNNNQLTALFVALLAPYFIWVFVALWRCAFNSRWPALGYVVRALIVLALLASCILMLQIARSSG